jgi:hypothetical protein
MIKINHMLLVISGTHKGEIYKRHQWNFHKHSPKAPNGIMRAREEAWELKHLIPSKFRDLLYEKYYKWDAQKDLYRTLRIPFTRYIEFTIGTDEETGIRAIAITHPNDQFERSVGCEIVRGRIKRQKGELDRREPYEFVMDEFPDWIYDPEVDG